MIKQKLDVGSNPIVKIEVVGLCPEFVVICLFEDVLMFSVIVN